MIKNIISTIMLISITIIGNAQMNFWTVLPNKINMNNAGNPTSSVIAGASTGQRTSNAVYDANGNILFFVDGTRVFNGAGAVVGNITNLNFVASANSTVITSSGIGNELAIVPVPGECNKWYLIYGTIGQQFVGGSANPMPGALLFCTVTITAGVVSVQSCSSAIAGGGSGTACLINTFSSINNNSFVIDPQIGGGDRSHCGIAVSKLYGSVRYLYASGATLKRFTISATGIGSPVTIASGLSTPTAINPWGFQDFQTRELELSADGTTLVWGNDDDFSPKIFKIVLASNTSTTILSKAQFPVFGGTSGVPTFTNIRGIEMDANKKTFISCGGGLAFWDENLATPMKVFASTTNVSNTQIELAKDGRMYLYSTGGVLAKFTPNGSTTIAPTLLTTAPFNVNGFASSISILDFGLQLLPDQVDGENYDYFFGSPQSTAGFLVNGTSLAGIATPTLFYNCTAITLSNTSTNATTYQFTIWPTNSAGNFVSAPVYISSALTTFPTNLLNMPGLNGTWLASYPGYYKVFLTTQNKCGNEVSTNTRQVNGFIQIATTPSPTENLTINNGVGGVITNATSIGNATNVGCYSVSHNIGVGGLGGTNNFSTHSFTIKEVNCTSGAIVSGGYSFNSGNITSNATNAVGINWNASTAGYFGANCTSVIGKCYLLNVTVTNPCGSTSDFAYLKISGAYKTDGLPTGYGTSNSVYNNVIAAYPNPATDNINFNLDLIENQDVTIEIYDIQGRLVLQPIVNKQFTKGFNTINVAIDNIPIGNYIFKVKANETLIGKFLKQ